MPVQGISSMTEAPVLNQPGAFPASVGAPLGGWNAAEVEFQGNKSDALILENFIPGLSNATLRKGFVRHTTGIGTPIRGLFAYEGSSSRLFAVTKDFCYNVTTEGPVGGSAFAVSTPKWSFCNYTNAAGRFGMFVNGADSYRYFNGSVWTTVATFDYDDGGPQTLNTTDLFFVLSHKFRLWFLEKDSLDAWYLDSSTIQGDAVRFPLGPLFSQGGVLHSAFTWTIDGGSGVDDYLCFMSTKGEVVAYQGTDPSSPSTWSLVGSYFVGEPVGDFPPIKYGGDVLILTTFGLIPFSKMLASGETGGQVALTRKIHLAYTEALEERVEDPGWQAHLMGEKKLLLINVPVRGGLYFHQYVMNIDTGAWCKFTGMNAYCWTNYNRQTYFGADSFVGKAFTGFSDAGGLIKGKVQHPFTKFSKSFQQQPTHVRAHLRISRSATVKYSLFKDYEDRAASTTFDVTTTGDKWNRFNWDEGSWGEANRPFKVWDTPPTFPGTVHSFLLEVSTLDASVLYTAADFVVMEVKSVV